MFMFKYKGKWYSKTITFEQLRNIHAALTEVEYTSLTGNSVIKKEVSKEPKKRD